MPHITPNGYKPSYKTRGRTVLRDRTELMLEAIEMLKAAGFSHVHTSRNGLTTYYALPENPHTLRVSTHPSRKRRHPTRCGPAIAGVTIRADRSSPDGLRIPVNEYGMYGTVASAIGHYILRSSGYGPPITQPNRQGTQANPAGNAGTTHQQTPAAYRLSLTSRGTAMHRIVIPAALDRKVTGTLATFFSVLSDADPEDIASMASLRRCDFPPDCDTDTVSALTELLRALDRASSYPVTLSIRQANDEQIRNWLNGAVDTICEIIDHVDQGTIQDDTVRMQHADQIIAHLDDLETPEFPLRILESLSDDQIAAAFRSAKDRDDFHDARSIDEMHRVLANVAIGNFAKSRLQERRRAAGTG